MRPEPQPRPALLLHGFGGDHHDWHRLRPLLAPRPLFTPDLPGHSATPPLATPTLAGCAHWLNQQLDDAKVARIHLLGYSLGGRIALTFAQLYPERLASLTLEGAHPGLQHAAERQQRQQQDAQWARRFSHEPLGRVWADWYQQPLFADLEATERQALLAARSKAHGPQLAAMLAGCSLARQQDLRPIIAGLPCPVHYLFGAGDSRYAAIAEALASVAPQLISRAIAAAGHNAHRAQPQEFAAVLNLLWSLADD